MPYYRPWGSREQKLVGARQSWRCAACGGMLDAIYELDHVTPLHRGGTNHLENAQALCYACHGMKTFQEERQRADERYRARQEEIALAKKNRENNDRLERARDENAKRCQKHEKPAAAAAAATPICLLKFAYIDQRHRYRCRPTEESCSR